jgi:2-polyprenyl-3-methyl-5-hydroxy-6-metoxy-1,4-benzoquinol methylase
MVTKVGEQVQSFYNKTPFPDYELDNFNSKEDLIAATYEFARLLDRSIPKNASIIDIGTGTGQLSAYLSLSRKNVWGIDFSDSSLNKAKALKKKLKLDSWTLKKVDILDKKQISDITEKFDYVLSMGVLHHTGNAYQAFKNIQPLLKPKGHIAIGLYNTYGRLLLKKRIYLSKTFYKNNNRVKDEYIRMQIGDIGDKERARGWWNDQYRHPHETTHTVGEVMKWFSQNGISYYNTTPSTGWSDPSRVYIAGVWNKNNTPTPHLFQRIWTQLKWIWTTNREGGYWITFGRKK